MEKIIYYISDCSCSSIKKHEFVVKNYGLYCRKCFYFVSIQDNIYDEIVNFNESHNE